MHKLLVILFLLKYLWISAVSICDCLFVCLFIHLFICVSVACLPLYGSVRLLVSVCLSVYPSFCVSVRPTVCPSVRLPVCVFVCLWFLIILWPRNPVARLDTGLKPCGCQRKTHSTSQETKSDNIRSVGICMYTPCAPSNVGKYKRFLLYCLLCW